MLDQRRAQKDGYITLREAAEITNYAPDYIGQLIRRGKIRGEQVYSNVAWVTTEDEVRAYMADKTRTVESTEQVKRIEAMSQRAFSYILYAVIASLIVLLLFMQYIFYVTIDDRVSKRLTETKEASPVTVTEVPPALISGI